MKYKLNYEVMKNGLFVIAGLLIAIWAIVFWGFNSYNNLNLILVLAGFVILVRILFSKQLKYMKESLFVISGLLIIIWGIVYFGLGSSSVIHILAVLAGFIVLVRLVFDKQLPK